jgi:hypothetical protein
VADPCVVLIASPVLLPSLKKRLADEGEVCDFTDVDALRALELIIRRRPPVIALERTFAATPRGAALIARIQADPALAGLEIRVVAPDGAYSRTSTARRTDPGAAGTATAVQVDRHGTRRAVRFKILDGVEVLVDGNPAALVDLSPIGAQVVSPTSLKPNQRVRMSLLDEVATLRFNGSVAWASFEIPQKSGPRYRAGIEFLDADGKAIDAYCARHKGS